MLSTYAEVTSLMSLTMKNLNEIYFVFSNFCVVQCISAVCAQCELDRAAKRNSTSNQTERCQRGRFSTTNSSVHQSIILSKHLFHIKSGSQNAKHQVFFVQIMYVAAVYHAFSGRCRGCTCIYGPAASSHRSSFRLLELKRVRQTGRNFMMVALR